MATRAQFNQFSSGGSFGENFPNPWLDIATANMPQSMKNALMWAEYLASTNGTVRMAMQRIISYFLTDIEFGDSEASDDEKESWLDLLHDTLDIQDTLHTASPRPWHHRSPPRAARGPHQER